MTDPRHIHDTPDDADPMVDALLREFVPADPRNQMRPPDLTSRILRQLAEPPSDESDHSDDRDPLIDVLLAEFVPSDPQRRTGPPDLTAAILDRLNHPAAEGSNDAEEESSLASTPIVDHEAAASEDDPVVDTLLVEFVPSTAARRKQPPELTDAVLAGLNSQAPTARENAAAGGQDVKVRPPSPAWSSRQAVAAAIAIAAGLLLAVWLSDDDDLRPEGPSQPSAESSIAMSGDDAMTAPSSTDLPDARRIESSPGDGTDPGTEKAASIASVPSSDSDSGTDPDRRMTDPDRPIQGIQLDPPLVAESNGQTTPRDPSVTVPRESRIAPPLPVVAASTTQTARDYWSSLGIQPTPVAATHEIASRMKDRLGVVLSEEALADPQRLRRALASENNSREVAKRWLALAGETSLTAVSKPENEGLIDELTLGVAGQADLDVTLASLVGGSNEHSDRFYETIGRGGHEGIAKRLAGVSLNADLRCVKCHDSHIGRAGTQDDYWSFVSLVRGSVIRVDNRWQVTDQPTLKPTFFELPDGRQRMAEARVSHHLLRANESIGDFQAWSKTLVDSRALAGSMVDSLWRLVHGRSLRPSSVDAHAPPVDGKIRELHRQLANDLRDSGFDVSRTLALIISSPMARRSVPDALKSESLLTANDTQRSEALDLVGAFAAAVETPPASRKMLLDVAMRRVGSQFSLGGQDTLLAQPIYEDPRKPDSRSQSGEQRPGISLAERLSVDFPGDQADLPVSWLRSIGSFDKQLEHVVFLSGGDRVTPEIAQAAEEFRKAGTDASALSRIWWILRR